MTTLKKIRKNRGFTLVELMIVVVIIGILASLAIYGVNKYVASAKSAEAKTMVGAISKGAVAAYNGENMVGNVLPIKTSIASSRGLCIGTGSDALSLVPSTLTAIQGKKYQSAESEWNQGDAANGWICLKFGITGPQYYQYSYTSVGGDTAGVTFLAKAVGDLDGDGATSLFSLQGTMIDEGGTKGKTLTVAPSFTEVSPGE